MSDHPKNSAMAKIALEERSHLLTNYSVEEVKCEDEKQMFLKQPLKGILKYDHKHKIVNHK